MINALHAPVEAAYHELEEADKAAAATPAGYGHPLGTLAPDMMRLEPEVKQITHAIRMTAYNAETTLARALHGRYARAGDEACALIREPSPPPATSIPVIANCSSGSTRSPRPGEPRHSPPSATSSTKPQAATRHRSRPALRGQTPPRHCMN